MKKIATADFSGVGDALKDAATFDNGAEFLANVQAVRALAAVKTAAAGKGTSLEAIETELNIAKEAERVAEAGRKAEEDLLKERERVAKAEEDARRNKLSSIKEEIALLNSENTAGLLGFDFDPQSARELIEAAGQPPEFLNQLQELQKERKAAEQLRDDLKSASDIREQLKTPLEKIQPEFDKLRNLLSNGRLSNQEAMAAGIQLARDFLPGAAGAAGASTLVAGTSEAYKKALELETSSNHEKKVEMFAQEQLKVQKDMLKVLERSKGTQVARVK